MSAQRQRACLYICDTTCHALCVPAGYGNEAALNNSSQAACIFNTSCHALYACRYDNEAAAPAASLVLAKLLSSAGQLLENVSAIYDTLEETVIHFTPTQAGIHRDSDSSNSRLCGGHVC